MGTLNDDLCSVHLTPADGKVFSGLGFLARKPPHFCGADERMESDTEETVLEVLPAPGVAHVR